MKQTILAVDDEPTNLVIIEEFLSDEPYEVVTAKSGNEALDYLLEGKPADVILLDRMMPGLNGLEVFERLKAHPRLRHIPVVMQTAAATPSQIAEGIEAGVFYYLTKPFARGVLVPLVRRALRDAQHLMAIAERAEGLEEALKQIDSCTLRFQSLAELQSVSKLLAQLFPDPSGALLGIREMLMNALEHGNLGITYDEKTRLNDEGVWEAEVLRRTQAPENAKKFVVVSVTKTAEEVQLIVTDEGPGFAWERYLVMEPSRATDNHGRGIAMSRALSFDAIAYQAPGNSVICRKRLRARAGS